MPPMVSEPVPYGFFADEDDGAAISVKVALRVRPLIGRELRGPAETHQKLCIQTDEQLGKL